MAEETEDEELARLERETISEAMRLLGQRKSKRKTEACRANARIRWAKEAAKKSREESGKSVKS